jgi:hypothetical protein
MAHTDYQLKGIKCYTLLLTSSLTCVFAVNIALFCVARENKYISAC